MLDTPILLNILPRIQFKNMPKTTKVKKKVKKIKTKSKAASKSKIKVFNKPKTVIKGPVKISKGYEPKDT